MYFFEAGLNGLTSKQLASFLNYKSLVNANSIIGRLGRKISQFYNIGISGDEAWWQFVADGEYLSQGFTWYLAEPFAEALMLTGMIKEYRIEQQSIYPEVIEQTLSEGAKRSIVINSYERNPEVRRKCLEYYGYQCIVCSFNFEQTYGEIGREFIHVHHLVEISSIGEEYDVNPIKDLRPVCPNCHAMLHRRQPAFSIEELYQQLIKL